MFEHRSEPLLSRGRFLGRVARSALTGALVIAASLAIGMLGYHGFEHLAAADEDALHSDVAH